MKLLTFLGIICVANVSAHFNMDEIASIVPAEAEELPNHGFSLPLMWLSTNHSIVVDYDNISAVFNHQEVAGRKIFAVSIIGALRKGKSFFMSYCLRYLYANYKSVNFPTNPLDKKAEWLGAPDAPLRGFSFKSGAERHTTGVIMWSDVFLHEELLANGRTEKIAIIILDTQGLFDAKTSSADNTRIFALGTLISSLQIFNLNDVLQENQLEYLRTATDYAQLHSNISIGVAEKPFQKLLFLMRDWVHVENYQYGKSGGDQYIRDSLSTSKDQNPKLKDVRDYMFSSFDDITGFLLPHPGLQVTTKNYDGRNSLLASNFKEHLKVLIELLLSPQNLVKKRIFDSEVSGTDYGGYMQTFFQIFQSKETPDIPSVYEAVVEKQLGNLVALAMKTYVIALNNHTDYNRTDFVKYLDDVHLEAAELTFLGFKSMKTMGMQKDENAFIERLKKEMEVYSKEWKKTSIKTWEMLQLKKRENEERIEALRVAQEKKISEQRKAQEDFLVEVERQNIAKVAAIEAQNNITWFEKENELRKIQSEKIEDQNKFEETLANTIQNLKEEAENSRFEMETNYKEQMKKMAGDGSKKSSAVYEAIESSRAIFMDMFKMQAEQQNADRVALQKRWDREDKLKAEEIERLKLANDMESKRRKEKLAQQERVRQAERVADTQRIASEQKQRKLQAAASKKRREQSREKFQKRMKLMKARQLQNKAETISSKNAVTMIVAVGVSVLTFLLNQKV